MQDMTLCGTIQETVDGAQGSACLLDILLRTKLLDGGSETGLGVTVSLPGDGGLTQPLYR
jgi:hypothetical protein